MCTEKLSCLYELTNRRHAITKNKIKKQKQISVCFDGLTFEFNYIFKDEKKGGS